jgi:uncharacterized protein (DUF4415 family)
LAPRTARPKRPHAARRRELAALTLLDEAAIDTGEMPEVRDWSGAERGRFYRPVKQQITLRLDADVVAWFRRRAPKGAGYQTDINHALRSFVWQSERKRPVG